MPRQASCSIHPPALPSTPGPCFRPMPTGLPGKTGMPSAPTTGAASPASAPILWWRCSRPPTASPTPCARWSTGSWPRPSSAGSLHRAPSRFMFSRPASRYVPSWASIRNWWPGRCCPASHLGGSGCGKLSLAPHYRSSQLLNTFTFSRLTSTCASGAMGLSTVCRRELV